MTSENTSSESIKSGDVSRDAPKASSSGTHWQLRLSARFSSSWRTTVINQAGRLRTQLALVPDGQKNDERYSLVREAIDKAEEMAKEPAYLGQWLSGELVERAWANLQTAQELLVYLQDEATLRARLPYLLSLATGHPGSDELADSIRGCLHSGTINRDVLYQVLQQYNVTVGMQHGNVRQFRNRILALGASLILALGIGAAFVSDDLRIVMGIGGLAGIVTTVLPLSKARTPSGPYGVAGAQALLKVPAGAATALLGVLLLQTGFGGLKPATGATAQFYAVLFGFSQQTFTRVVDRQASSIVGNARPRLVAPASPSAGSTSQGSA